MTSILSELKNLHLLLNAFCRFFEDYKKVRQTCDLKLLERSFDFMQPCTLDNFQVILCLICRQ